MFWHAAHDQNFLDWTACCASAAAKTPPGQ
jgi:hypothetical protein